jgi:hypothetical protein
MPVSDMDRIIPLYDAIQIHRHEYSSGGADYSVTTLLDPPRVVHLNKRHVHKVDLWVQDLMHSWTGTASHSYMEYCLNKVLDKRGKPKYRCEERNSVTMSNRLISGAYDVLWLERLSLWDMKNTSTWKAMFGDKLDWTAQQNMYRYLYWLKTKETMKELNIIGMFRDWSSANKMRYGKNYPNFPVVWYPLKRWSLEDTRDFMQERVDILKAEEDTPDDALPLCTYEDMWSKPDKWAVKADNRKNALRVADSRQDALDWIAAYLSKDSCKHKAKQLSLECRPSVRTRCEHWCPINSYCNQYNDYLKALAVHGNGGQ